MEVIEINTVKDVFLVLEAKKEAEKELKALRSKLKKVVNNLDLDSLDDCNYEKIRDLLNEIQYYVEDKNIVEKLSMIAKQKKSKNIQSY